MSLEMPTVLVLGAGPFYVRAIKQIRDAGYRTVVLDRNPAAPGLALANVAEAVDISDPDAVLAVARSHRIDGVLPLNDFGVRAAALVATEFGLPGLSPHAAELSCDKGMMRQAWQTAALPNPAFRVISTLEEAQAAYAKIGPPLVLKPTDAGGGGRGVSVVREWADLEWAYRFAAPFADNHRMIVESYLEGVEVTVEGIIHSGRLTVLTMSDKIKPLLRTRVATSLAYPADLPSDTWRDVEQICQSAVTALGIADGPCHVELIVTNEGPVLVELGARGGGGHIFSTIVEVVTGVKMVEESVRVLIGQEPQLVQKRVRGCVYYFFTPERGIIRAIRGLDEARSMPGVIDLGVVRQPGDALGALVDSLQRSGFAVVAGRNREEAIHRAARVARTVVFDLDRLPEEL